ncbi:hypothetical protein EBB59_13005 [Lysobacter pythonis]|uniref:Uncharacterized protein n=1 Tax=Solilutibacter pythonis TaxID=2483112 RepID=A0A3M2HJ81_9GAMM|nr:hypothetical protein EBB59_13005 [Lysobacter pythonis]
MPITATIIFRDTFYQYRLATPDFIGIGDMETAPFRRDRSDPVFFHKEEAVVPHGQIREILIMDKLSIRRVKNVYIIRRATIRALFT